MEDRNPTLQRILDDFARGFRLGEPDPNQTEKNPDCPRKAGTIECLDSSTPSLCAHCEWWSRQAGEDDG